MTISPLQPVRGDYVTKGEFGEFKVEMRNFKYSMNDFRDEMYIFKADVSKRFDAIDARFSSIDKWLISHDVRFASIDSRLSGIDNRIDILSKSLLEFRDEVPRHMGMLQEKFKDQLDMAVELIRGEIREKNGRK